LNTYGINNVEHNYKHKYGKLAIEIAEAKLYKAEGAYIQLGESLAKVMHILVKDGKKNDDQNYYGFENEWDDQLDYDLYFDDEDYLYYVVGYDQEDDIYYEIGYDEDDDF
jgi:hypothetical protein